MVQALWLNDVVIDDLDFKAALRGRREIFDEFPKLWPSYTIRTVHRDGSVELLMSRCSFERRSRFLVVSLLCWFAILISCAFGVQTAGYVVELRSGEQFVVGVFSTRCLQSCD